ncbi:GNAT family protein [Parachlamydia sp. AcF125]|uniref:GNAT family N-acetyltransferase n=1 Tax=Parachlamydia sp. AcF125 TaxID=2795736 RepID=UPI001BCA3EB2|nr:GNAT family protein [Parachlamydia sp. AcF125]MBS4167867.1 L-amino acid N-acetyltransferase AaaT [Parachlamydia sp. AcF125]
MTAQNQSDNDIRYTEPGDAVYLKEWLMDKSVSRWFPMCDEAEINDAVNRWIGFYRYKCSLTAVRDGVPCGLATLYLQPYRKLAHQCEFGIIVGAEYRNQGVGTELLNNLMYLAKETFRIELLHLQVYAENPAIRLYERFGFKEFGRQNQWIKEEDRYVGRVFMERFLT